MEKDSLAHGARDAIPATPVGIGGWTDQPFVDILAP